LQEAPELVANVRALEKIGAVAERLREFYQIGGRGDVLDNL
jgi:hypothetical protein